MSPVNDESKTSCHVVALPYPGRGHVNPMMNLCKLLSLRSHLLTITFVVTEEWLDLIRSEQKPENIRFATIPNVLPSERIRAANMTGFLEAILTKMEEPFEQLLDRLGAPPTVIFADVFVSWVVDVGKRRNIPVALLWPMSASVFSIFQHLDLLVQNGHFPTELSGGNTFMSLAKKASCHIVVLPFPGRGHVNPMMNLCKLLASRCCLATITFVVTEEWLDLIRSEQMPENIRLATIPNVLPSERNRAANMAGFLEAILTKMEEPFEQLLDRLVVPPTVILADVFVSWVVDVGQRRNIPVALLWAMPTSVFSVFYHFDLLVQNGHFPTKLSDRGGELVDYIPGLSPIRIADLPSLFHANDQLLQNALKFIPIVPKAQYLLFSSIYELEAPVIEALKPKFPFPLYSVGPLIPYFDLQKTSASHYPEYLKWLESQAQGSVLYVSIGSFLSITSSQMDEIVAGLCHSGVKFLIVSRDNTQAVKKEVYGEIGMVVPWCDQLRVLSHPSIGGFWTHFGWNSTMESVFAGVPMIGFPLFMDQPIISKFVSEDWKIGLKVKREECGGEPLVRREEISELVKRFMNPENEEKKEMAKWATQIQEICRGAIQEGGSSEYNLGSFMRNILK